MSEHDIADNDNCTDQHQLCECDVFRTGNQQVYSGRIFLFLEYSGIFNLIDDFGFGGAVVKRISEGREQNEFFSAFVVLRIILLTMSVGALLLSRPLLVDLDRSGMFFWLLMALVVGVSQVAYQTVIMAGKTGAHQTCGFLRWQDALYSRSLRLPRIRCNRADVRSWGIIRDMWGVHLLRLKEHIYKAMVQKTREIGFQVGANAYWGVKCLKRMFYL